MGSFDVLPEVQSLLVWAMTSLKSRFTKLLFAVYGFRRKTIRLGGGRAEFEYASRTCFELFLGNHRALLQFTYAQGTVLRVQSRFLLVSYRSSSMREHKNKKPL